MIQLLEIYWITIIAAFFCGSALALTGALLVTRQATVQILAVGQGAGIGVLFGIILAKGYFSNDHLEYTVWPLLFGLLFSALTFLITENLALKSHSKTALYLSSYIFLWASVHLLIGMFPVVESHTAALYFGDIVTLSKSESIFFLILSFLSLFYLWKTWRVQCVRAFQVAILDEPFDYKNIYDIGFYSVVILLICFSIQLLGILFTISCLYLPTTIMSFSKGVGVFKHLLYVTVFTILSVILGFLASLYNSSLSTTPTIVFFIFLISVLFLIFERLFKCK